MVQTESKPIEILMVEDNAADVRLTTEAFRDTGTHNRLNVVGDGEEAMDFLRREGRYSDAARPDLILLDLNLPRKDGREVLKEIKQDPDLKRIPVVVITTSDNEKDILKAYDMHVNAYITKPVDFDKFVSIVGAIEDFWLTVAKLPPK